MAKRIFVSYNFKDAEVVRSVKGMLQSNGGRIDGQFVFVTNNVSAEGSSAIDKEINRVLSGCDAALFVVGNNSHNSPWINREAQLAKSKNLCIVLTQFPGATGGVPHELASSSYLTAPWNLDDLSYYLNRCQ